jgi:PAS domain S-box-containing protein
VSTGDLRQRVDARDHLADAAETVGRRFESEAVSALQAGDAAAAEAAVHRGARSVESLAETLRVYQAELHAQADELHAAQARTESALARFTALFAHLPVAALLVDARGELLDRNGAATTLFALGAPPSVKRFVHRLVEPGHYQRAVRPAFHEARAAGVARCDDVEFVTIDGRRFWGELHLAVVPASDGADTAAAAPTFACIVIDRTEQRELVRRLQDTHRQLASSEAMLAEAARLAQVGSWEYDVASARVRWSPLARTLLEVGDAAPSDLEAVFGLHMPAVGLQVRAALADAVERGIDFDLERDVVTARGRPLRVRVVGHPEFVDGRCMRVTGVVQDITSHHRARQAIDHLTQRLNLAREAGGIGIWDCDLSHDRVFVDDGTRALLGLPAEAPDTGFGDLLAPALDVGESSRLRAALDAAVDGEPLSIELKLAPGARGERWLHLAGRAEREPGGAATRLIGCAWDSTGDHVAARLLAAKDAAESANRAKSQFLSRMSHELRTPLNAILGFAQLMRLEADSGDLVLKPHRVHYIEAAARHLLDLINEVLDVSAVESGQMRLRREPLALAALVHECLPLVTPAAEAAGITIRLDPALADEAGPSPVVVADRLRLKQVLINLLSNAVKYNRPSGLVDVAVQDDGALVRIAVRDTGLGLTPARMAELFQPFNRVGAEATRVEGTGMGLYVSRRFVEVMGGTIVVDSAPQQGSTFTVMLPAGRDESGDGDAMAASVSVPGRTAAGC